MTDISFKTRHIYFGRNLRSRPIVARNAIVRFNVFRFVVYVLQIQFNGVSDLVFGFERDVFRRHNSALGQCVVTFEPAAELMIGFGRCKLLDRVVQIYSRLQRQRRRGKRAAVKVKRNGIKLRPLCVKSKVAFGRRASNRAARKVLVREPAVELVTCPCGNG